MPHLHPERLALLALSEPPETTETDHLATCPTCRDDLDTLRHVTDLATTTHPVRDLPPPSGLVWASIARAVAAGAPTEPGPPAPAPADPRPTGPAAGGVPGPAQEAAPAPVGPAPAAPAPAAPAPAAPAPVGPAPVGGAGRRRGAAGRRSRVPRPRRRGVPRWVVPVAAAAAAAVLAAAGTAVALRVPARRPPVAVTAQATLAPLPGVAATVRGRVAVLDGDRLRLEVSGLPPTRGYYEAWLLDPDRPGRMTSLGALPERPDAVLAIPPRTDLTRYRLVDVSVEAHDGDAAHSGDSLLRGLLG